MTVQVDRHKVWTYEDSLSLPTDGQRYEVLDGVLYVSPSPGTLHQILSRRLQFFFYQLELEGMGYIFNAPMDLLMPGCTPVQPDLIYLRREQRGQIKEKYLEGVPYLVAEILSPSTRSLDRVKKLNRFAQNGVPYYLLVDPEACTLEVLSLRDGRYSIESLGIEDRWEFEGRVLEMAALFEPLPEEES